MADSFFKSQAQILNKRAMEEIQAHAENVVKYGGEAQSFEDVNLKVHWELLNESLKGLLAVIEDQQDE